MKTKTKKELALLLLVAIALSAFVTFASALTIPKRMDYGSTWGRYLREEKDSIDALFFGSSISYCDVIPAQIWDSAGISSYVMSGPEQTIPISYYYIKESCKTQSPKVIFLELTGMFFKRYQDYTKVNIGYMPQGINRFCASIFAAEKSEQTGLFFPLYNYHSRWSTLEPSDFGVVLNGYPQDDLAGYTFLDTAAPIDEISLRDEVRDKENYDRNLEYLGKISEFCESEGILPVFYIAPTCWRLSAESLAMLEADLAKLPNVRYYDFNRQAGVPAFDSQTDWYDELHFNYRGAEKFSEYLGELLTNELGIEKTANADRELWDNRSAKLHELTQKAE